MLNFFKPNQTDYYPMDRLDDIISYRIYNDTNVYTPEVQSFDFLQMINEMNNIYSNLILYGQWEIRELIQLKRVKRCLLTNLFTMMNLEEFYGDQMEIPDPTDGYSVRLKFRDMIQKLKRLLDNYQMFENYPTTEFSMPPSH